MLVRVAAADDESLVRQLVQWHAYARRRGLDPDLVILDERPGGDADRLEADLQAGPAGPLLGKPGGVFVLDAGKVSADDAVLLTAAARAVLGGGRRSLADQLDCRPAAAALPPPLTITQPTAPEPVGTPAMPPEGLRFWNGYGGFASDGREYVILIDGTAPGGPALPPAPWTNVLANPGFGCLVTEAGLGYSWAGNSQLNRLTPWSNDPVSDPPGEAVYLRDEDTGAVWTPTPLAARGGRSRDRPPRPGLHPLQPPEPRAGAGTACAGAARRPGQAGVPERAQRRRPAPSPVGDVLRRVGARELFGTTPPCKSCASATRNPAPCSPATPGRATLPARSRSRPSARGRTPPPLTAPSSWAATARRPRRPPSDVPACRAAPGRRSTRAPRS